MKKKTIEQLNQELHKLKDEQIGRLRKMYEELLTDYTKLYKVVFSEKIK